MNNVLRILIFLVAFSVAMCVCAPVSRAVDVVNYTVYAWTYGYTSTATYKLQTRQLNKGQAASAKLPNNGGVVIAIPANSSSGYFFCPGIYPIKDSNTSATAPTVTTSYFVPDGSMFYAFSSSLTDVPSFGDFFPGYVYIPAHSGTLYLWIGTEEGEVGAGSQSNGGLYSSSAFMNFIADPVLPDNSGILQQILSQLQATRSQAEGIHSDTTKIKDELTATPQEVAEAEAILDQIESLMDEIDTLTQKIEDNTNRPDPGGLVGQLPGTDDYLHPSDSSASSGMDAVSQFLGNSFLLPIILMVLGFAFVRYVLFGKAE